MTYKCNRCLNTIDSLEESIQRASNGVFHIRGECPTCGAWIKFVPYADSYMIKQILFIVYGKKPLEEILQYAVLYDDKQKEIF